jgi:UDP-3-O-[3-hydroxymyristoyl] glucosamine N-acyltransferase
MADPAFFQVAGPFTVAEIALRIGATVAGAAEPERMLRDVAPLQTATADELAFIDNRKYLDAFRKCRAGAVLVHPSLTSEAPENLCLLVTEKPYRAYAVAAQAFYPEPPPVPWISPDARIDGSAEIGEASRIEPFAVIGARTKIGRRALIGAGSVVGAACTLGDDTRVGAQVSISHAIIGARVKLYPGVRIGQDGFGFSPDPDGFVRVPQLGRVIIGDDAEIGANTTIDRGAGPDTIIGAGTMIDNLVQIGHNVQIGRNCVLVAQVGISGSTRLGDFVMIGGQGGLIGHLEIGTGARIGAQAGVASDVAPGETVMGSPAVPVKLHHRQVAALKRLATRKGK